MQQKELRKRSYAFASAANSRNKILVSSVAVDPTNCLLFARDALYKPVTV
jgi:hypothetical protein